MCLNRLCQQGYGVGLKHHRGERLGADLYEPGNRVYGGALWLNVCEKADCHLLDECLARHRTPWGLLGKLVLTDKMGWRYDCYRIEEDLGPVKASLYTIRNGFYGIVKWLKYVKRT